MTFFRQKIPEGYRRTSTVLAFLGTFLVCLWLGFECIDNGYYTFPPRYGYTYVSTGPYPFVSRQDLLSWLDEHPDLTGTKLEQEIKSYAEQLNATRKRNATIDTILFWCVAVFAPLVSWLFLWTGCLLFLKAVFWVVDGFKENKSLSSTGT